MPLNIKLGFGSIPNIEIIPARLSRFLSCRDELYAKCLEDNSISRYTSSLMCVKANKKSPTLFV